MKKVIAFILSLSVVLLLSACAADFAEPTEPTTESTSVKTEKTPAVVVAADIVASVVAAAVIITIHHSKYLRLKIKFTLHTIRNADFCYCILPRAAVCKYFRFL